MELQSIILSMKKLVESCVIKYNRQAREHETVDSLREYDLLFAASEKIDTFESYGMYEADVLTKAGISENEFDIDSLQYTPHIIPYDKRERVLEAKRQFIIENYEEHNNYYRKFLGLPKFDDESDIVYLTDEEYSNYSIQGKPPIHEIDPDTLFVMEKDGIIKKYLSKYPQREYLKFIGYNKIDILVSRKASNFSIIKIDNNVQEKIYEMFVSSYERARDYTNIVLYNKELGKQYAMYDNFMALSTMFMAMQQFVSNIMKLGVKRDILDWEFIQKMYEMYHIPFIKSLPMEYHNIILRNVNYLLSIKSTDKVILDICKLLGYEDLSIYRYYLIRNHKIDEDGNPIFIYKDGIEPKEIDPVRSYNYYFHPVDIKETNILGDINDIGKAKTYKEITDDDPYWIDDELSRKELYDMEFNYRETKYISINMVYRMTKLIFRIIYGMRMILDNKKSVSSIRIKLPKINASKDFDLFHTIIFIVVLVGKKMGFRHLTMTSPSLVSHFYGFNFNRDDIQMIKDVVEESGYATPELLEYLSKLHITTPKEANDLFRKIESFNNYIEKKLYRTNSIKEYLLFRKIRDIILQTKNNQEIYRMKNGQIATTLMEYITSEEPLFVEKINTMESEDIGPLIDHCISKVEELIPELGTMAILNDGNNPVLDAISSLIKFFKSNTVDLTGFNVVYLFNGKYDNMIKTVDDIHKMKSTIWLDERHRARYSDDMLIVTTIPLVDRIPIRDTLKTIK